MSTPLEQFKIVIIKNLGLVYLNTTFFFFFLLISLFLAISQIGLLSFYCIAPNFQYVLENLYLFLNNLVTEQATKKSNVFFSFISTLFFVILFANYMGMLPMGFTLTSHIVITLSFGLSIIVGLTLIGIIYLKVGFLNLFIPKDVSVLMLPLLVLIEIVSYISRGFSLSIRLFANLMAGHTLLNILSSFIFMLVKVSKILMVLTSAVVFAIVLLEIALAFLQAYVFSVLTCIYLHDSVTGGGH
jgi:F-type H+-transporting ATPase subunit a